MLKRARRDTTTRRTRVGSSRRGMGLVEILITASIVAIIALGMATLFKDVFTVQNRANVGASAGQLKSLIKAAIEDGKAWGNTVAANSSLICLNPNDATVCTSGAAITGISLRQSDNTVLLDDSNSANGFTSGGAPCSGWNSTGNNACPITYDLTVRFECVSPPTCKNPTVTVEALMAYSPLDQEAKGSINPSNYRVFVTRGFNDSTRRNDPFIVRHLVSPATSTSYGGACTVNSWTQRQLNSEDGDAAGNVVVAANQFTLQPGTYECRATAPAFKAGVNKIRVRNTANNLSQESGSVIAPVSGGSSIAVVDINISIGAATTFLVEHFCTAKPSDDVDVGGSWGLKDDNAALGVPSPGAGGTYSDVVYTVVSCIRKS